jgi:hypothetical protein
VTHVNQAPAKQKVIFIWGGQTFFSFSQESMLLATIILEVGATVAPTLFKTLVTWDTVLGVFWLFLTNSIIVIKK